MMATRSHVLLVVLAMFWPGIVNGQTESGAPPQEDRNPPPQLPAFIPPLTDEDRRVAFPDVGGHTVHDAINYFVLFDQLEWQAGGGVSSLNWDTTGWVGRDLDRVWFRTEGEAEDGGVADAYADLLYGRAIARWWDVVAGVRQDVRPGPARTWAAVGIQGLAPYWFEVEATAYLGAGGRTHFRFEGEYELLLTNRLMLQPLMELEVYGKADPERGIGAGISTAEAGLRVRYEFRREFAPYLGVAWQRRFFGTADAARAVGDETGGVRLAVGLRFWF
jgi:copper resistance protein B